MISAILLLAFLQPDNAELSAMTKVDQLDRAFVNSPSEIDWERIAPRDAYRQQRVREMLQAGEVKTAEDFDNAALIMQHGSKPSDYLLAHELAAIAGYLGNFGSLPALAEDRWLESLGRRQRWGSQFTWEGVVKPLDPADVSVTDKMRKDLFLPTLEAVRRLGMKAAMADFDGRIEYIKRRMDPKLWKNSKTLAIRPSVKKALDAVRRGEINTAEDYVNAAVALSSSRDASTLLLAHELSMIAMARRSKHAPALFMRTMDAYLTATGLPKRYAQCAVSLSSSRVLHRRP